ncbi:MAG: J domain-containing protein [Deltaproteobacteria bacterium]|nr:J domain-containing protein [Deltaproteobacteria bacterium]
MEKYYKILEIQPNATEQEVRQSYRDLVNIWHPDRFSHDAKLQKRVEEKLKEINDAYQRIINHLNDSHKRQESQKNENQEKTANQQPPPHNPHNSWICPECLRTNYIYNLTCSCGFKTNEIEIRSYRADQTPADLYDTLLFNKSMEYEEQANFLARYLLRRFPNSKEADIIRNNSPASSPPKQTKPSDKSHQKKWGVYIVLSLIVLVPIISEIIGALKSEPSRKIIPKESKQAEDTLNRLLQNSQPDVFDKVSDETKSSKRLAAASGPTFTEPIKPLPVNGAIKRYVANEAIAPLKIVTTDSGHHYFVKLVDWYTGNLILTIFIRSGQSIKVYVPLGSYKLKYATGVQWYGTKHLFGPKTTQYNEADKKFDFEVRGDNISGYTVELVMQPHGNLRTNEISAEQF